MGQRHQLFIIARIPHRDSEKARYRCLVAMHHQWLYGRTALAACKAFLTLVRSKENADIIRAEIASIALKFKLDERLPRHPAPFLNWLIYMALTTRNEEKYFSSALTLNPNMGSHEGDNNDGITVFDVTDPSSPAYCFVSIRGIEANGSENVRWNVPVSGEAYLRAYYPFPSDDQMGHDTWDDLETDDEDDDMEDDDAEDDDMDEDDAEEDNAEGNDAEGDNASNDQNDKMERIRTQELEIQQIIDSFKEEKLVELWMLAEAWPGPKEGYEQELTQLTSGEPKEAPEASTFADADTPLLPRSVLSLSEISLRKAISYAGESGDITGLDLATSLPRICGEAILSILAERENYSSDMFGVLLNAMSNHSPQEVGVLDLSPYALSSEQVIDATVRFPDTKTLNLNGNLNVTGNTLKQLLPSLPDLSKLVVYDCPGISLADIDSIRATAPHVHAIYHRDLMIRSVANIFQTRGPRTNKPPTLSQGTCPPSFTFAFKVPNEYRPLEDILMGCSLSSLSPRPIVIAMIDFHDHLRWATFYDFTYSRAAQGFFSSLPRAPHVHFKERGVGTVPDPPTLATKGWIYIMAAPPGSPGCFERRMTFHWGFVRYRFSSSSTREGESGEKPLLEEVKVVNLETWLKEVDTKQEVEKEWVEKLAGTLSPSAKMSMLTEEQARLALSSIPLFTASEES